MKERPILFSGPMVRALLDGTKTQTRRIVKPYEPIPNNKPAPTDLVVRAGNPPFIYRDTCPYGQPGDRIWVRESFLPDPDCDDVAWDNHTETYSSWSGCGSRIDGVPPSLRKPEHCIYRASWTGTDLVWRPSMHMPRWACRLVLEIVSVRVERLNNISEQDAIAEGIERHPDHLHCWKRGPLHGDQNIVDLTAFPKLAFRSIWESINSAESWAANPWVWVVEFKKVAA